ncbi:MAG: DUF1080 domain-containing protein [Verrucomicrobiae bacterium]|nr:DUF1080 domain-containing protein [Verrucomicrobiae bacterium]
MKFFAFLPAFLLLSIALAGAQGKQNPVFAPIEDDPNLPRVLLIGDSISIGYTLAVRDRLEGIANVHRVPANAGHTGMGIEGIQKWLEARGGDWDVIHFNFGLWDLCYRNPESKNQGHRDKVHGTQEFSVEEYVANLETIVGMLEKTGAHLIFATTTPVPEKELGRVVGDDLRYNEAAVALMRKHGIEIDDLHAVMAGKMDRFAKGPGDVHYTEEGYGLLADQVAGVIAESLTENADGVRVLFDGTRLEPVWEQEEPGGWAIEKDGSMVCRLKEGKDKKGNPKVMPMGDIWTHAEYGDFELSLSYKLSEGANSGVFYRSNPEDSVQDGLEVQLMDNVGFQKTHGAKDDRKLNASFYDAKAPSKDAAKPVGEWNDLVLRCEGPRIRITLNGEPVIDVNIDDWDTPGTNPDGTTNKFKRALKDFPRRGRIGFQNHGQVVWFRDEKIEVLD